MVSVGLHELKSEFGSSDLAVGCAVDLLVDMVWSVVETLRSCYWGPEGGTYGDVSSCCRTVPLCARL